VLKASQQERDRILSYMCDQAPDENIELAQKVYSEQVHAVRHDIWDVHTDRARWWVITSPTNLYRQDQFPNMDLALTFHVGLCLRIPKSERQSLSDLPVEPLIGCWRGLDEVSEALERAEEVEDFQAIGVRCREALLTFSHIAQDMIELSEPATAPRKSDFRAWIEIIADVALPGQNHQERRGLLKTVANGAWKFANWLTHARDIQLNDAEAAFAATELTVSLFTTALIRHVRRVPDRCPSCASHRLSPERGVHSSNPETVYERPVCEKCGWTGTPVIVKPSPPEPDHPTQEGECVIMSTPLRSSPGRKSGRPGN
jgi:hypothetical protein